MRHRVRLSLLLSCAMALTACGGEVAGDGATGAAGGVSITNCGRTYPLERTPGRVVTLDQSSTETLLALGAGDRMVGTSNLKTRVPPEYRAGFERIPVLNPGALTGEQLRAATPDLVVAGFPDSFTREGVGTREELWELGLPSYVSTVSCPPTPDTDPFESLFTDYENLGRALGAPDRAGELITAQRAALAGIRETADRVTGTPSVLWLYSTSNGQPYVAGGTGIPDAINRMTGTRNVFADIDQEWPEVSWERIVGRDPDIIVLGDLSERGRPGDSAAEKLDMMRRDPAVAGLRAVTDNRVIEVSGIEMDPSVRSVDAARVFVEGLRRHGFAR